MREFQRAAVRLHILHHAADNEVHGAWLTQELSRHGYRVSPGTLYPTLHRLQGGDQASGAAFPGCAAVGKTLQIDGQSIGYHHEVRVPEGLRIANLRLLASRGSH